MQITPSDLHALLRPSPCDRRVFLRLHGEIPAPPSAFEEILFRLGLRYEREHLATLGSALDLSRAVLPDALARTESAVFGGAHIVYQAALRASVSVCGAQHEVVGRPDFIIRDGEGFAIRDVKLARRVTEEAHPEILLQLELYGWLFERTFGRRPAALQVLAGDGTLVPIVPSMDLRFLPALEDIVQLAAESDEPRSPVGWTKCGQCGFHTHCWSQAETTRDVALIPEVDQGLARALYASGISTYDELLEHYDETSLADFRRPHGAGTRRVGQAAPKILRAASALATGHEILLHAPDVPQADYYAIFDIEGLPPQQDELDRAYLWGLQVFGRERGPYLGAFAGVGPQGDEQGWTAFLAAARSVLEEHGDIPFVHWHHYERVKLDAYLTRFGDPDGTAARVRGLLLDLLPITKESVVLPLSSYSLKQVERYVGFRRTQKGIGGDWAMAKYIEAVETHDEENRRSLLEEIRIYNAEDLQATWAVLEWLRSLRARSQGDP